MHLRRWFQATSVQLVPTMGPLPMHAPTSVHDPGFYRKKIKKCYCCANCITVPKELEKEVCPQSSEQNEIRRLHREVRRSENLVKIAEENT